MVEEEKFQHVLFTHPSWMVSVAILIVLSLCALIWVIIYLRRQTLVKNLFLFKKVEPIKIPGWDLISLILLLFLVAVSSVTRSFFYPASIVGIIFIFHNNHLNASQIWGVRQVSLFKLIGLSLWLCFAILAVLTPLSLLVDAFSQFLRVEVIPQKNVQTFLETKTIWETSAFLLLALVLAPIAEEMFFRGFLYPYLKSRIPATAALFITSLIFAYIHFDLFTFLQLFVFGFILNLIFEETGSLPLCMGIHMSFNAFNAIWLLLIKSL